MKKNIILLMTAVFGVFVLAGCSEDDLKKTSAVLDSPTVENDFDRWLAKNYLEPYNIDFKYRFKDVLGDMDYNLTPADYGQAIKLAKLTLHLTLQVYDEVTGNRQFISENFPKIVHVIGSPAYNENNNIVLGVAEGGKMMTLYQVNIIDYLLSTKNIAQLNELFFKTMHHEFGHILPPDAALLDRLQRRDAFELRRRRMLRHLSDGCSGSSGRVYHALFVEGSR